MNEDQKESNWTCCCTGIFNTALSLCRVLEVTLYFSEDFLEAVAEVPQPLGETVVCFLTGVQLVFEILLALVTS